MIFQLKNWKAKSVRKQKSSGQLHVVLSDKLSMNAVVKFPF